MLAVDDELPPVEVNRVIGAWSPEEQRVISFLHSGVSGDPLAHVLLMNMLRSGRPLHPDIQIALADFLDPASRRKRGDPIGEVMVAVRTAIVKQACEQFPHRRKDAVCLIQKTLKVGRSKAEQLLKEFKEQSSK